MKSSVTFIVVDTNIVLDLLVFDDPASMRLKSTLLDSIDNKKYVWLATQAMRDELERVLSYPKISSRMAFYQLRSESVMQQFDHLATMVAPATKAAWMCKDPDDQKFIDLAVQHQAQLFSKDRAVLCMAKRLQSAGAWIHLPGHFI
ncbi:MAG TPA: putative toxin-antitoxin system toxin component, PIN family [Burkholderiaceae bacterium]|nr:putative toxin-antitoxin system toxin component, PIN family [Burkholderiaceae bacterium]